MNRASYDARVMRWCLCWNLVHTQGLTYRAAGEAMGVSAERARQMALRYERHNRWLQQQAEREAREWMLVWGNHITAEASALNEALN